jgi:hypothetical protein
MSKKITLTTLIFALFLTSSVVLAQTSESIEVSQPVSNVEEIIEDASLPTAVGITAIPPRLGDDGSLHGKPGETIQTEVRVRNNTATSLTTETVVEDFIIEADGKTPIPVTGETNSIWSLAQWISLPSARHQLPAFGSASIPVVIRIPSDARPGGRYAMIAHQPASTDNSVQTNSASISQRVGTLVYLKVDGDVVENAALRNIIIPRLSEYGPIPISFQLENLSDIHIQPMTTITIKDMLGRSVDTITVRSFNVFPYTLRDFSTEWDRVWGWGRYTAEFSTSYGSTGKVATAVVSFWLIPYTLVLSVLIVLLAIIGIGVAIRRHWKHRNSIEQQHISLLEDRIHQLENDLQNRD